MRDENTSVANNRVRRICSVDCLATACKTEWTISGERSCGCDVLTNTKTTCIVIFPQNSSDEILQPFKKIN